MHHDDYRKQSISLFLAIISIILLFSALMWSAAFGQRVADEPGVRWNAPEGRAPHGAPAMTLERPGDERMWDRKLTSLGDSNIPKKDYAANGDSYRVDLVGRWASGPCGAVAPGATETGTCRVRRYCPGPRKVPESSPAVTCATQAPW